MLGACYVYELMGHQAYLVSRGYCHRDVGPLFAVEQLGWHGVVGL